MKKWYSVELEQHEADHLRLLLRRLGVVHETSACFNLVHFEMLEEEGSPEYAEIDRFLAAL